MALTQVAGGMLAGSITSSQISSVAGSTITGSQSIPRGTLPTGSVLQVVQGTSNTSINTTSGAYITTGLTASITPSSSSSKILVLVNGSSAFNNSANNQISLAIFRGATNLHAAAGGFGGQIYSTATIETTMSMMILDSPATTSSTTYAVYFAAVSGSVTFNVNSGNSYIILQEISA
jgi:hypothetical protein